MDKKVNIQIARYLEQWVGYWGYGNQTKLSQSLQLILQQKEENKNWYISSDIPPDGILATLSASGLSFDFTNSSLLPDVWVKIAENRLILGRENFGRVPLYWLQQEEVIWFASRFQLLLPLVASPNINLAALYGYSCFSYVPQPLTPIENIYSLTAGTEQIWKIDQQKKILFSTSHQRQSWQIKTPIIHHEKEAILQLQTLLKTSIERQIVDLKDKTVGVFLSGGLDSSIVATLLVQAGVKVRAYSLDFGDEFTEYSYAEQVAQWLKIPLIKVDVTPKRIKAALIPTIQALDLPFGDGVTVPLFLLCQVASQEVNVIFNGEGGDQLFAGWTNKPLIAASIYQGEHPDKKQSFGQNYLRTFHRLWGYESQIFQPDIYEKIQLINPENWLESALDPTQTNFLLHRLRRASLMLKGAQNIHLRATNLAFAHGLKVRSPFCDLDLAQWTFQLSEELFLQGACEKYILKRAVEDWLPSDIVWRQKRGMGVPLTSWCLQNWWSELGNWLNPSILKAEGIWQSDLAARVALGELGGLIQGRRIGEILWLLIVWQMWRSQNITTQSQMLKPPLKNYSFNHPFWLPYFLWRYKKQWF